MARIRARAPAASVRPAYAFTVLHGREPLRQLNHTCHDATCWNPHHVYEGTQADNIRDMIDAGRHVPPTVPFAHGHQLATGVRNPHAKLTEDDVRAIRSVWTGVRGQRIALAAQYGVDVMTISCIAHRKTWKHI